MVMEATMMAEQNDLPPFKSKGTSFLRTSFNGLNAMSGIGIIAIPYTLSRAGWLGIALLLSMASLTCYTCFLLKRCMDSNPAIKTYPDVGWEAFGRKGKTIISIFMYLELFLVPTGFLITEGDNMHKLFPDFGFQVGGHYVGGRRLFIMVAGLVILPSMWLKEMSLLSFISAGGVVSTVFIIVSIFWTGVKGGVGFSAKGKVFDLGGVSTALSLYAFCYAAQPVFPTLYSSMKDKTKFSKVVLISYGLSTISYVSIGVIGYLMFGQEAQSQVTLNLPTNEISSKIAIYTTLVGPLAKYALVITPVAEAIERSLPKCCNKKPIIILMRTLLLATTIVVALAFPYFGVVMAFVGAVINCVVSIMFPCLCYLKISESYKRLGIEQGIIMGIVVIAVLMGGFGTYTSVKDIVNHV